MAYQTCARKIHRELQVRKFAFVKRKTMLKIVENSSVHSETNEKISIGKKR